MSTHTSSKSAIYRFFASENKPVSSTEKRIYFSSKPLTTFFITVISLLSVGHLIAIYFKLFTTNKPPHIQALIRILHMDSERSIATTFSGIILFVAALLLMFIHKFIDNERDNKRRMRWLIMSFVFFFLCLDETFIIHERLTGYTEQLIGTTANGFLHWAWVVPYSILVVVVGLYFLKFVIDLPKKTRKLFFIAGFLYVFGAIGMEVFEGYAFEYELHALNQTLQLVEEVMELSGICLLINALIDYIQQRTSRIVILPKPVAKSFQ